MRYQITANELKTKGVSVIEKATSEHTEAVITVRGKEKFVVIPIEAYNQLRKYELDGAIRESLNDWEEGRIYPDSIEEHIKRITDV
jgi:prevent-host-death family protein